LQMHDIVILSPVDFDLPRECSSEKIARKLPRSYQRAQLRETTQIDPLSASSPEKVYLIPAPLLTAPSWPKLRTRLANCNRYFIVYGFGLDSASIVEACRDGAFDVLLEADPQSRWTEATQRAVAAQGLWWQLYGGESIEHNQGGLIGRTPSMKALRLAIQRLGPTPASVLILGESGTGKERVAAALHAASGSGEFVALNCAAVPAQLLEAELFGVKRGAFTGATADRPGLIEKANGGTLFLDEIGEMEAAVQPKLLRFLETRSARRLGSNTDYEVDLRIVAATNRDLDSAMSDGSFRPDLYFRLAEITLNLAPLRERLDDIPLLSRHFLSLASSRFGQFFDAIDPELIVRLQEHYWPGNVRELKSAIDRLVLMHDGPVLRSGWWDLPVSRHPPQTTSADWSLHPHTAPTPILPLILRTKRDRLNRARELVASDRLNLTEIAAEIGVHPSTLFRWRQAGKV
jgi:DNA-binding NtrC family response regulator